ncbi:GGDEF domain-containing protein [Massilia niabensis]|uniref:diguanylate cyclase n=1 Tax=Massilia niabensis TaxID=544910 RepID=A0ABW0L9M3_9BURK
MSDTTEHTLLACFDESVQGVALFDSQDVMLYANSAFRSMLAVPVVDSLTWEGLMRNCHAKRKGLIIADDDIGAWLSRVQRKRRAASVRTFESDLFDGRWLWVVESTHADGHVMVVATDITELKTTERTLRQARDTALVHANTDSLTGLFNRRYALDWLPKEIQAARLGHRSLCVGLIDLDDFKEVNDTHGHQMGDHVLKHLADKMRCHMRPADTISRIGGDEFLIIFPDTSLADASCALSRVRQAIAHADVTVELAGVKYSFSAGIAELSHEDTSKSLLQRADTVLYAAKRGGRGLNMM